MGGETPTSGGAAIKMGREGGEACWALSLGSRRRGKVGTARQGHPAGPPSEQGWQVRVCSGAERGAPRGWAGMALGRWAWRTAAGRHFKQRALGARRQGAA